MNVEGIIFNAYETHKGNNSIQLLMQLDILEQLGKVFDGDMIEIGSHVGINTNHFANILKKYNKKVISVDPYNGQQEGGQSEYNEFKKNNRDNNNVEQHRVSSFSKEGVDIIKSTNYYYVFVDGLHTEQGAFNDLCNVIDNSDFTVICLDDFNMSGVNIALKRVIEKYDFLTIIEKPEGDVNQYKPKHKDFVYIISEK